MIDHLNITLRLPLIVNIWDNLWGDFDLPFFTKRGFQPTYEEVDSNHGKPHLDWTENRTFEKNNIDINIIDHLNIILKLPLIVNFWHRLCDDFPLPFLTKRGFQPT